MPKREIIRRGHDLLLSNLLGDYCIESVEEVKECLTLSLFWDILPPWHSLRAIPHG